MKKIIEFPMHLLQGTIKELEEMLLSEDGTLKSVPCKKLHNVPEIAIAAFCTKHGRYQLITDELLQLIRPLIEGKKAIEIGAGAGDLAHHLGIKATDNYEGDNKTANVNGNEIKQTAIPFSSNVENINYKNAIHKYRPDVVIAAHFPHKQDMNRNYDGGTLNGLELSWVVEQVPLVIVLFNANLHAYRDFDPTHGKHTTAFLKANDMLYSRTIEQHLNLMLVTTKMGDSWAGKSIRLWADLAENIKNINRIDMGRKDMDTIFGPSREDIKFQNKQRNEN